MSRYGMEFWPRIMISLPRIEPGRPLPAALIAAFERIGWGTVSLSVVPSRSAFFDYAECFVATIETRAPDEETQGGEGENELGAPCGGKDLPWPVKRDEDAFSEGLTRGIPRHLQEDVDRYFDPTDEKNALLSQAEASMTTADQRPFEIRDWSELEVFLRLPDVRYGGAFGTLLTVEGRTYLTTFEEVPDAGQFVRFADRRFVG